MMRLKPPACRIEELERPETAAWGIAATASLCFHGILAAVILYFAAFSDPKIPVRAIAVTLVSDVPGLPGIQADVTQEKTEPATAPETPPEIDLADEPSRVPPSSSTSSDTADSESLNQTSHKQAVALIEPEVPVEPVMDIAPEDFAHDANAAAIAPPLPKRKPIRPERTMPVAAAEIEPDEPVDDFLPAKSEAKDRPVTVASAERGPATVRPPRVKRAGGGNPPPVYPERARRRGVEGRLVLAVKVSARGLAQKVKVKKSSGSKILDWAAQDAVEKWKFVPAMRAKIPVPGEVDVTVVFKLKQSRDG